MQRLRRRPFRARRRLPAALFPVLLAAALSVGFFSSLSVRMKPMIKTIAVSKATNLISLALSEEADDSLMEQQLTYRDFVDVETGGGQVTSLSFRTTESTRFKRMVVERLVERLEHIEQEMLAVPLGNLTGIVLFSAMGPSVRVRIQSVGDVTAEFRNEFTSAGVNQTRHSVYLDLQVTVYLLIPGEVVPVTVSEQVCVAETVIVGQVPDTYLNLEDGVN